MNIIIPYSHIFNQDNWFYNKDTYRFLYSDNNITITNLYVQIPFNEDLKYNKKILYYFNKFMLYIADKIPNPTHKYINYTKLIESDTKPIVIYINPIIISDTIINLNWGHPKLGDTPNPKLGTPQTPTR
jgi:hypothetical protein